jgi:hypothetical protein
MTRGDLYAARNQFQIPAANWELESPEASRRNHHSNLYSAILGELIACLSIATKNESRRYLLGAAQRVTMMQTAKHIIAEETDNRTTSLHPDIAARVNLCLNSFYLNLAGTLDNLAWAATHELRLLSEIDERKSSTRRFCSIGETRFQKALLAMRPTLADALTEIGPWLAEIKAFRDPAAHRLPLIVFRGALESGRLDEYQQLQQRAYAAMREGHQDLFDELNLKSESLLEFRPILETPRTEDGGFHHIPKLIEDDNLRHLNFIHEFLTAFAE